MKNARKPISTTVQLARLKTGEKPYDVKVALASGLVVRVGTSGKKSYRWDRGAGMKPRIITYGSYPSMGLKAARDAHEKAKQQHIDGVLGVQMADAPKIVSELVEQFYAERIVPKRKRPHAVRQILDHDVLPVMGNMKISSVNAHVCRLTVKKVVDRGAKNHAGKVLAILKQMFRYAVALEMIDRNPAEALDKDFLGIENNQRNRILNHEEIKQFWEVLDNTERMPLPMSIALQLLLLLGIRTGELRLSQWNDLDTVNKTLTIPVKNQKLLPNQVKSAKDFVVPLDEFALGLFMKLKGLDAVCIFPGTKENKPFTITTLPHIVNRLLTTTLDIEHFTPHDLRRTVRSNLSKLGVPPHIAEKCLNHSMGKIQQTYDTYDYLVERRAALEQWSDQLQIIIGLHENVILMKNSV